MIPALFGLLEDGFWIPITREVQAKTGKPSGKEAVYNFSIWILQILEFVLG